MSYYGYGGYWRGYDYDYIRPRLFGGAIRTIIIINVVVYFVMVLFGLQRFFSFNFGLVPRSVIGKGEIENYWGRKEFFKYYFVTGVGAGVITLLCSLGSPIPVVGASGAIYGILVAFGMMFPNRYIYFYFLIPIKAKYFVVLMGVMTFISSLSPGYSNISHLTHLGGLLIGFVYLKREWIRFKLARWMPSFEFKKIFKKVRKPTQGKSGFDSKKYDTDETLKEEVDRILDKISSQGYDSLTEEEKKLLYLASEYFAKKSKKS